MPIWIWTLGHSFDILQIATKLSLNILTKYILIEKSMYTKTFKAWIPLDLTIIKNLIKNMNHVVSRYTQKDP